MENKEFKPGTRVRKFILSNETLNEVFGDNRPKKFSGELKPEKGLRRARCKDIEDKYEIEGVMLEEDRNINPYEVLENYIDKTLTKYEENYIEGLLKYSIFRYRKYYEEEYTAPSEVKTRTICELLLPLDTFQFPY